MENATRKTYRCTMNGADAHGFDSNGAFVVALAEGRSAADAIAFAQKAAAISVTRPGAQSSVPHRKEVEA